MSKIKTCNKWVFVAFCAFLASALFTALGGNSVFADTAGIVENGDARWEYVLTGNDLQIKFYDKTPAATTVTVPSLDWLKSNISGVSTDLDTYFLMDADPDQQDADYPSFTRRAPTANTTVLDMTGTSKIQISGVKPIINPEIETELKFGPNMVISDRIAKRIGVPLYCNTFSYSSYWDEYTCKYDNKSIKWFDGVEQAIPNWGEMTAEEQEAYMPGVAEGLQLVGCRTITSSSISSRDYDPNSCYILYNEYTMNQKYKVETYHVGDVFANYKLKLTNFNPENFNYIGWGAFRNSTFNEANTSVTIPGAPFTGSQIFQGTNVKNITINSSDTGAGLFRDCRHIESITFGNGVDTIVAETFAGTNLTSFDFGSYGIKNIGANAFEGSDLTEINLTGVESIDYQAFKDNDITEIYLPKSITRLGAELFKGNGNMKKATVAYDTMTSGTAIPFWVVLDNNNWYDNNDAEPGTTLEELYVVAPYAADEEVSATHLSMDSYAHHYDDYGVYHGEASDEVADWAGGSWKNNCGMGYVSNNANYWSYKYDNMCDAMYEPEKKWAKPDEKKNVIAPKYFQGLHGLKKIIVGDGYEYIGGSAFIVDEGSWSTGSDIISTLDRCSPTDTECNASNGRRLEKVSLPESLKGIGSLAFGGSTYTANFEFNIPRNIEYIGQAAFKKMFPLSIDVDFPNLKYLGDDAFAGTMVRNIVLHDKLEYMGWAVFHYCYFINDITFDVDVYNPDGPMIWSTTLLDPDMWIYEEGHDRPYTPADNGYGSEFRGMFGSVSPYDYPYSQETLNKWGLKYETRLTNYKQKFGTITFTEKAVTAPMVVASEELGNYGYGVVDPEHPNLPTSCSGIPFNYMAADLFDISATPWKVLRPYIFNHSVIGELRLPSNLEVISTAAFSQAKIDEELILPETLLVIGDGAFDNGETIRVDEYTPKITKLPESLEFIGYHAFWGDTRLTADAYLPNIRRIDAEAFTRTSIRDVYLPDTLEWLNDAAFVGIPTLRDITIDADFGRLVKAEISRPDTYQYFPQSLIDYSGIIAPHHMVMIETISNTTDSYRYPFETFYTLFSQHIVARDCHYEGPYGARYKVCNYTQGLSNDSFGALVFTDKNVTDLDGTTGIFSGLSFDMVDMGAANWTKITKQPFAFANSHIGTLVLPAGVKTITEGAFHDVVIENDFEIPSSTRTIDRAAFQGATGNLVNGLPEGVKTINEAAFYEAGMADDLVIPSTVTYIGESAFNAGSKDVYYNSVTIKPSLTYDNTEDQLIHQIFWGADLGKLIIESPTLPALSEDPDLPFQQEFWSMPMSEVVLKNLTGISHSAFEGCTNLKKVDATGDPDLALIGEQAFINDELLDTFLFASGSKNKVITVKSNAFQGTAFTELGDSSSSFDLTAAKFDATPGHSFANMPKLKKVTVPRNFSNATIPEYTFYNDALLEEAIVDYKITDIKNAAFAKDDNLKRIFIWGDTIVQDQSLDGYTAPTRGPSPTIVGPTIPAGTDIYAYSTAKTEAYAANEQREDFEGKFYPLDEVLYLTSNHPTVLLNEDDTDFDKSDLTVYAMRRDGIILESDSWQEFDGNAYARAGKGLTFEHMAETIAEDEAFGTVWDTPVPLSELDLSNQNFANLAYSIRPATDDPAVLTVDLIHPDRYTAYLANTNVDPRDYVPEPIPDPIPDPTPDPEPEPIPVPTPPKTLDEIVKFASIFAGSGIAAAAIYFAVRKRR